MNAFDLKNLFTERYGESDVPIRTFFAPGRVNLIGDHTDYSGGLVFPCAIHYGTTLLIRPSKTNTYQFASTNFDLFAELSDDQLNQKYGDHWINYPLGVLHQFMDAQDHIGGFECLYSGNVPNGAGLSSSASISIVTAYAINELFACDRDLPQLVKVAQMSENNFVGVQCGVMDQYAVTMAKRDHAMMLDCETLECEQIPLDLGEYSLVLFNSNQRRELSESKYNERVIETQMALKLLQKKFAVTQLAQVSTQQLQDGRSLFAESDQIFYQRARHVVTEHHRVQQAVAALRSRDLSAFGQLMSASHKSLRDDYDVSSEPLNVLVDIAAETQGVLGARLTGAGFGGCTVNLVHKDRVAELSDRVGSLYSEKTGLTAKMYKITTAHGVREVSP